VEILTAWTLGLSYDIAVLQANYIIGRGLRGGEAIRAFELESTQLAEKIRLSWRAASKQWGLSWKKQEKKGVDFDKPFREVGTDLRELIFSAFPTGEQSPERASAVPVVSDPPRESVVSSGEGAADPTESTRGKARSAWLDSQITARHWSSDTDIAGSGGPTYNTIQRYRSGEKSTRCARSAKPRVSPNSPT
jgi:hypothetical protein